MYTHPDLPFGIRTLHIESRMVGHFSPSRLWFLRENRYGPRCRVSYWASVFEKQDFELMNLAGRRCTCSTAGGHVSSFDICQRVEKCLATEVPWHQNGEITRGQRKLETAPFD